MAGYPLKLTQAVCAGALACGPQIDPSPSGGTDGAGSSSEGSTSVPSSTTPGQTVDSGEAGPQSTSGSGDESSSSSGSPTTTGLFPEGECDLPGQVCGEFLVCQCSCDVGTGCCLCEATECTDATHCEGEDICSEVGDSHFPQLECVPPVCASYLQEANIGDPSLYEGDTCLSRVSIGGESIVDISPLSSLQYVHEELEIASSGLIDLTGLESVAEVGALQIDGNPSLTSIAQLAGLQRIGEGGYVSNNPSVSAAEIHTLLDAIEGGDAVVVCGNLDDVDC